MKLKLTESSELAFEKACEEPYHSINQENGISVESFMSLLKEIETFIPEFENAIGMQGATTRIGERLHEAVHAGRTTIERHLTNQYFSELVDKTERRIEYENPSARKKIKRNDQERRGLQKRILEYVQENTG